MTFVFAFSATFGTSGGRLSFASTERPLDMARAMLDTVQTKPDIKKSKSGIEKRKSDIARPSKLSRKAMSDDVTENTDSSSRRRLVLQPDSTIPSTIIVQDSIVSDSLDSDSATSKNMLDAPVAYEAQDSMVYDAQSKMTRLFGSSKVTYLDLNLDAEVISMNMDSSVVHANGVKDSTNQWVGLPLFKQGDESYESERMSYNFKSRKGFIQNVTTEQGEGFMYSESSKRTDDGTIYSEHATYTTCDHDPPHFYLALSRAKVKPGKEAFFGPAYLVVEDVPLPLAIPFGFFPFRKKYSSGFIMPTYGDETNRGFYLRDGGYYFAISDYMDLKILGEIYTKGSWGLNGETTYRKRYRYSGNFYANYQNTVEGEKNMPDYQKTTSFKIQWTHRQDPKSSPNSSLSASVNFATSSFERKNLSSMYNPASYTQSTRTSSVSYSRSFPSIGLTIATSTNLTQNVQDSTLALSLPDLNVTLSRFYPFKRKRLMGRPKWYEKISMSYTGRLSNSISTKEDKLLHSDLIKDWRNGMYHDIPISASFQLFKYINISPTFAFHDRMYTNKIMRSWDTDAQRVINDTVYGFYNVYDWNLSLSANTTLYGFYKPWKSLSKKIMAVRHVLKPTVSYSFAPDFSSSSYGYYDSYVRTDAMGNVTTETYSPFAHGLYSVPGRGKMGSISLSLSNNLEMKIRSDKDSTGERKISLIDELYGAMSYNFAAVTRPWSNLNTRVRLKLSKRYTFSMAAVFATYAYQFDENGRVVVGDRTEWSYGRFGRFQGTSQNLSYTFSNSMFSKKKRAKGDTNEDDETDEDEELEGDTNIDPDLRGTQAEKKTQAKLDDNGYMKFSIPWTFTVSYGITMSENTRGRINPRTMRYPYKFSQTLNFSGNIRLSDGWNINYSSGYDFNYHKLSMTTASLTRDLHCFSMSCSVVLRPYTSYNFSFRAKISTLADVLKWDKRSSYSSNIDWY